jgi:hypothetical protein
MILKNNFDSPGELEGISFSGGSGTRAIPESSLVGFGVWMTTQLKG